MQPSETTVGSYMCDLCQAQLALHLCMCSHPSPRLCTACQSHHVSKNLNNFHSFLPISMLPHVLSSEDLRSARLKLLKLQEAEGEITAAAREIDRCMEEMQLRGEELIAAIHLHCEQERVLLAQYKAELTAGLEACVKEAKGILISQSSNPQSRLTSLLVKKVEGRFLASERLFEWSSSPAQWHLNSYLGLEWKAAKLDHTEVDEDALTEVEEISDLNAFKCLCVEKLKGLYSASIAESKVASQSQTLEMKFYKEHYTAMKSCLEVLEILRLEDISRLPQSVENCFRSLCGCKSPKLISAYSQKTIELASRLVHSEENIQLPPQLLDVPCQLPPIPVLVPGGIKLFNPSVTTATFLRLPDVVKVDAYTAFVYTRSQELIMCGGGTTQVWKSVYRLIPPDGVAALQEMIVRRRLHGVVACDEDVFVFGGSNGRPLRVCECYKDRKWVGLPDMHETRYGANPVLYNGCIYVVGGEKAKGAELFTVAQLSFSYIPLELPERTQTCAFVINDFLIVISKTKTAVWMITDLSSPPRVHAHIALHPYSSLPPLLYQDRVYVLLHQCGNCIPGAPVKMWDSACSNCVSVVVPD